MEVMSVESTYSKFKSPWIVAALLLGAATLLVIFRLNLFFFRTLAHELGTSLLQLILSFDYSTISFLNGFAHRSWVFDNFMWILDGNALATAPLLIVIWWLWFKEGDETARNREFLFFGIFASFPAVFAARLLALSLPFRERPLRNPLLHFVMPYNMRPTLLISWSSFPSDHGALWFSLAAGVFLVSRGLGMFLILYVSLTLSLARIYLGVHYPTDILVGGFIGVAVASLARNDALRTAVTRWPMERMRKVPELFYACFFLLTAQMTEGFGSAHAIYDYLHLSVNIIAKAMSQPSP
jgi:undecaprenyl-diphosphatase